MVTEMYSKYCPIYWLLFFNTDVCPLFDDDHLTSKFLELDGVRCIKEFMSCIVTMYKRIHELYRHNP